MFEKNDLKTIEDGREEATSFPALIEGRHLDGWNTLHWTLGWCLWVGVCFRSGREYGGWHAVLLSTGRQYEAAPPQKA